MTDPLDVDPLIRAIQASQSPEESFQRIYRHYLAPVTHFFVNRGFPRDQADDLAQETLLRVYTHLGEFRLEASFETWLFQIAGSVWKNALRRQATLKRQAQQVSLDEVMNPDAEERAGAHHEPKDAGASPLDQVLGRERTRLLAKALERLPAKMREVVLLRVGQGLKYREIAAVLQVSIATVKTQLSLANQRLKPLLEKHFDVSEI